MSRALNLDCRYNNSFNGLIGNVFCPKTMCLNKLCVHKKTFASLNRGDYQCFQCGSRSQMRNIPFEEPANSFFEVSIYKFEGMQKSIQDEIGDVYSPTCPNEKRVHLSTNKRSSIYNCKKCEACSHVQNIPFKEQKPTFMLFGGNGTNCLAKKRGMTTRKNNQLHFWRFFSANDNQAQPNVRQEKQKQFHWRHKRVGSHWLIQLTEKSFAISFHTFRSTQSNMIISSSSDSFEWSLDFGLDSITLIVKNFVHEITTNSEDFSLAAWLLSQ